MNPHQNQQNQTGFQQPQWTVPERVQWQPMPAPPPEQRTSLALRLIVVILIITAFVVAIVFLRDIFATLSTIFSIGHGTPEQQARGLTAVGVIGAILVGSFRAIANRPDKLR